MILVGVIVVVDENKIRLDLFNDLLDALNQGAVQGDSGILIFSPE
jgi:hypothetical protein